MIRIGKIVATHGIQGALVLKHFTGASDWLKPEQVLFLEMNRGSYIPHFVTAARAASESEYIVSFEDPGTPEAARKLVGKHVYASEEVLPARVAETPLLWIGFNIVDRQTGSLGPVEDVYQTGHQWLAKVNYQGREVLIPLIDPMIVEVNVRNRYIRMDLPEGLLDL